MSLDKNKLKDNALKAIKKWKANLKEFYYHKADIPAATVEQIADFVRQHPETQVETKQWLGNTYRFYTLKHKDEYFYLETNNDRILQLDGFANGKQFVSYRSYRDYENRHTPIRLT